MVRKIRWLCLLFCVSDLFCIILASKTYYDYAKDLCKNYVADRDKHSLCKERNRYIGISKEDYAVMIEDHRFVNACLKSVLKKYDDYFTARSLRFFILLAKY